jgi:glycosyltransferase involved in cell wall biosynthesis
MKDDRHPLITIIVAVFNSEKTLQQCIDSVAQQTYENKELIVIDGGSKDGTVELLRANQNQIAFWVSEPDKGIYNAWNKGLMRAKGEWICFVGADDFLWDEEVLEQVVRQLVLIPHAIRLAYSQIMLLNADGEKLYPIGEPWEKVKERFKQYMCIPHPGLMHRHSFFKDKGNFDESFRIAGDYEIMLRELKNAEAVFLPDVITVGMRQGGVSSSPANTIATMREVRRAQKLHGFNSMGIYSVLAITQIYVRLFLWNLIGEKKARKVLDLARRLKGLPPYWTKT